MSEVYNKILMLEKIARMRESVEITRNNIIKRDKRIKQLEAENARLKEIEKTAKELCSVRGVDSVDWISKFVEKTAELREIMNADTGEDE